ncbi:MAG: hypothetical protein OEM50_08295 [Gammaproteobacteria bacterium]|nr:hypothetical protein [Gammaproteobacteria bacterium]MDH3481703.1 hypothetical protein [Gammaproteobacteria bacterium]
MKRYLLVGLLVALLPLTPARGGEVDISGNLEAQVRAFWQNPAWVGQEDRALQPTVISTTEIRWYNAAGNQRVALIPYLRWDATDEERSLADLREAYWAFEGDNWEVLIGANAVFWGVTESVHLVDIINQTDFAGDIDGEDKLGQPMVSLMLQRDWGDITAFVMPYFRERTFAGSKGSLRPPLPVDTNSAVYESSHEENHLDLALRYSHYMGDIDIGLSVFSGTSREPHFVQAPDGGSLLPVYDQIVQFGVDLQYTKEAWLWKLEAIARDGVTHAFVAAVGGFEYTLYQVAETSADVGLLLEYQYDGRNEFEPVTIADNDVFVATRLAFNDVQDTAVLAGVSYDTDTGETFLNIEAERRFGQNWFGELRVRAFSGAKPGDSTYFLKKDDYVQLSISRYF